MRPVVSALALAVLAACAHQPASLPTPPVAPDGRRPGALMVAIRAGGQPLAGASIRVSGDALPEQPPQEADGDGNLALAGLDGDDTLVVSADAPGYLPASRITTGIHLADGTGQLVIELLPATGELTGQVVSEAGPLARVCVSDGRFSTLTDAAGTFRLAVSEAQTTLKLAATGYATRTIGPVTVAAGGALGPLRLERLERRPTILVLTAVHPFGAADGDVEPLEGLYRLLQDNGFELIRQQGDRLPDLQTIDTVLVPVPSQVLPDDQRQVLTEWLRLGGKLVVLGEWGGFGPFAVAAANALLEPANLAFGLDTLRQVAAPDAGSGSLRLRPDGEPGFWDGVGTVTLQQAASVRLVASTTVPLDGRHTHTVGRLGDDGLRIQGIWGHFSPIGVSLIGAGRVVAIGDASLWAAAADGTLIRRDDNAAFALNVFRW